MSALLTDPAGPLDAGGRTQPPRAENGQRRVGALDLAASILGLVFAALLLYPLLTIAFQVFVLGDGTVADPFVRALALSGIWKTLLDTAVVVGMSTLIGTIIAVGFAWLNERTSARLGFIAEILPLTPMMVPVLAGTVGWVFLAAPRSGMLNVLLRDALRPLGIVLEEGPLNIYSMGGMIFLYTLTIVPFIYLPVSAALSRLDPALEEASRVAGVGPFRSLLKVTIPAIRPSIVGGIFVGAVIGLGTFSVAVILGSGAKIDILAVRIYHLLTQAYPPQLAEAFALSLLLLVTVLVLSSVQRYVLHRGTHATVGGKGIGASKVELGAWKWPARIFMIAFVALASIIPFLGLAYVSLLGYWSPEFSLDGLSLNAFQAVLVDNPLTSEALRNSLLLSMGGALITLIGATLFAIFVAGRAGILPRILDMLAKAPGGLSHLIIAIAFLAALSGPPFRFRGSLVILILAFIVFYMPQAYVSATSAHGQISKELSEASAVSGAGTARTLHKVVLPLMLPGLAGGGVMLFVLMMSEVTGSALLSGSKSPVIGFVMIDLWTSGTFATIAALGIVMTLITSTMTVLLLWFGKRQRV